jgi:hypothetical protein
MIIDTFLVADEWKLAELRCRTLAPVVDQFVAVRCTKTHQGQPADLTRIPLDLLVEFPLCGYVFEPDMTGWPEGERGGVGSRFYQKIEAQHRDSCRDAALTVTDDPDTIVMVSDVDELPHPDQVQGFAELSAGFARIGMRRGWFTFAQRMHSTALDYLHPVQPWYGTCATTLGELQPQAMRDARTTVDLADTDMGIVGLGGWHISWCGTDEERQRKLETFSHAEIAARGEDPADWRARGVHANGEQLVRCDFPGLLDWPAPLVDPSLGFTIPESWRSGTDGDVT